MSRPKRPQKRLPLMKFSGFRVLMSAFAFSLSAHIVPGVQRRPQKIAGLVRLGDPIAGGGLPGLT